MTLTIVQALGLVTVQDLGRRGQMHAAVPPGGALVPELLVAANGAAGNPDDALALEILGKVVVRSDVDVVIATPHGATLLVAGKELTFMSGGRRCTYLAMRGGIRGSRGTLLCAELGSPLRTGDRVELSNAENVTRAIETFEERDTIRVIAGPDLDAFGEDVLQRLVAAPYRVLPTSDRVGTRLHGEALPRAPGYRERSRPMVIGALEVPGDGQPIVLGPEHPTTGGYPIVAVIANAELGRFFAIRLGGNVRFVVD